MEQLEREDIELIREENDTTRDKYLTMNVAGEMLGFEISRIAEIISIAHITKVPKTYDYVKGIINLRGDIVPVIDIRLRFKLEERPYDSETCIVVIEQERFNIGIIVDNVSDVKSIKEEEITVPPSAKLNASNKYVKNIGRSSEGPILLIDIEKLLYEEENEG